MSRIAIVFVVIALLALALPISNLLGTLTGEYRGKPLS